MSQVKTTNPKLVAILQARSANRRENRPELTPAQIKEQKASEPSAKQLERLRQFKVPEEVIADLSKYDASELLDKIFDEVEARKQAPISAAMIECLVQWQFDRKMVSALTQGEAQELLRSVAPALTERKPYESKNPIYQAVMKKKPARK